jgi:membrane-associated protease RseP (regulator of RpoE activity)
MPKMMTWSFGFILITANLGQAQSEAPKDAKQGTGYSSIDYPSFAPQALNTLHDPQSANTATFTLDPRQFSYFGHQDNGDQGSGLTLAPVDEAARVHLKLPKGQGLIAISVVPQGPAALAGVCQNDILLTLNGFPLGKPEDLEERLKADAEKDLSLALLHRGQKKTLLVLPKLKVTFGPAQPAPPEFWIGVQVTPVDPALRAQLQIPADQGLITTLIMDHGPAARAGFKVNDILLSMNGKHLLDQGGLATLVQQNGEKPVAIEIVREGSRQTIEVTPERRKDLNLLAARVQHAGNWNIVRPGVILQGNMAGWTAAPELYWNADPLMYGVRSWDTWSAQHQADPLAKRLDTMAAEIKDLGKAVEELSKVLKDRK